MYELDSLLSQDSWYLVTRYQCPFEVWHLFEFTLEIGKFMYQYRSGLLPYSFSDMFLVTHQVHSYGTRSSEFFYLPQCRTNIRKFSISFQGPKFFNSLSFEIRNATSTASFCCKLKAFLLS